MKFISFSLATLCFVFIFVFIDYIRMLDAFCQTSWLRRGANDLFSFVEIYLLQLLHGLVGLTMGSLWR